MITLFILFKGTQEISEGSADKDQLMLVLFVSAIFDAITFMAGSVLA